MQGRDQFCTHVQINTGYFGNLQAAGKGREKQNILP